MNVEKMGLAWIVVKDLDAALVFYTQVMGLSLKSVSKEYGWAELAGAEGMLLGIAQHREGEDHKAGSNAVMTMSVKDLLTSRKELAQKGVQLMGEVIEIPGHVKLQTFKDPDGNVMQLVQEINSHP